MPAPSHTRALFKQSSLISIANKLHEAGIGKNIAVAGQSGIIPVTALTVLHGHNSIICRKIDEPHVAGMNVTFSWDLDSHSLKEYDILDDLICTGGTVVGIIARMFWYFATENTIHTAVDRCLPKRIFLHRNYKSDELTWFELDEQRITKLIGMLTKINADPSRVNHYAKLRNLKGQMIPTIGIC